MQYNNQKVNFYSRIISLIFSLFFFLLLTFPNVSHSQQNSFVYLKDGKFILDNTEYFPLAMNYGVNIVKDINGNLCITPHAQYCKWGQCDKGNSGFYCGTNKSEWNAKIRKHIDRISEMGFNTIRLSGLGLTYNPDKTGSGALVSKVCMEQYDPNNLHCIKGNKRIKIKRKSIDTQIKLYEDFMQIVKDHNEAYPNKQLKVILTTGTGGLQSFSWIYNKFLRALGERFKNDPNILAYEPNFEGWYLGYPAHEKDQKYERAENFAQWYYTLKESAPNQLVTYGVQLEDVFNWDPQTFPVDFINLHMYTDMRKPYESIDFDRYKCILKWFSEAYNIPWIIGETGLAGNDIANRKNPKIATEIQQKEFAYSSLIYLKWYGGIGYAWWQYKEVPWLKATSKKAHQNYFGLIRMKDEKERAKAAAQVFEEFDPASNCNTCFDPDPEIYYNPYGYKYLNIKGRFTTPDGKPVKNVYIVSQSKSENYFTFTDENGEFKLFTNENDELFTLRASYPGMTVIQLVQWGGPKLGSNLDLKIEFLDKNRLP